MRKLTTLLLTIILLVIFPAGIIGEDSFSNSGFETDFTEIFDEYGAVILIFYPLTGKIVYANKAAAEFYDYSIEALISFNISDLNALTDVEISAEMQAAETQQRNYFIFRHKLDSGEVKTVEVFSYPVIFRNQNMQFSIIHDITDKVYEHQRDKILTASVIVFSVIIIIILIISIVIISKSKRELKKLKMRFENLNLLRETFNNASQSLIYLKDENLKYVFVNKAVEVFYGKKAEDIIGKDDFTFSEEEFTRQKIKTDLEVLEKNEIIIDEIKWNDRTYETTKFPVKLPSGKYGVGAYVRDITDNQKNLQLQYCLLQRNSILNDILTHPYKCRQEQLDYVLHEALLLFEIEYLSYHDSLTGLHNRRYFEELLNSDKIESKLPISVVMCDVNGLKLINDIFGHAHGDMLLKSMAEILNVNCRIGDVAARWGGDEFVMLLPSTDNETAKKLIARIKEQFSQKQISGIRGSVSIGSDTKITRNENILFTLNNAEELMYSQKTLERDAFKSDAINSIINSLHNNFPREKEHAEKVRNICCKMGKYLKLDEIELKKLKDAAFLHDIGKIVLPAHLILKNVSPSDTEWNEIKKHPVIGYRILNSFDNTLDIAELVLTHQERWDGSGYPKQLICNEIPYLSRIISLAESYDRKLSGAPNRKSMSKDIALESIRSSAGKHFDPVLAEQFIEMAMQDNEI
ncbi:MAG: hypothetical protein A2Y17_01100 [Clostridiales bacterium GWF2_38_85]|nr:MAG: hypothetical protein A2Y17_01100 [Clostridiales bacterium GWF2_38_85]